MRLSREADLYFREHECEVRMAPTPEAIAVWNDAPASTIRLFHVTC